MPPPSTGSQPARTWGWAGVAGLALAAGLLFSQWFPADASPAIGKGEAKESALTGDLQYAQPQWPEGPSPQAMFLRLSLGTISVLGLCAGSLWMMKRWLVVTPTNAARTGDLRLVESLHLGNRCMLHLVSLADRQILVGADPAGIKSVLMVGEAFEKMIDETPELPAVLQRAA
ncbi:MAG: flagellar biosynthetic protein FliO [Gemmataceae bacterium]